MTQPRLRLAYRWPYHAFSTGLGLLSLGLVILARQKRVQPRVAAAAGGSWTDLTELVPSEPDEAVRPPWADRLLTERAVLRVAGGIYLTVRTYQLGRSSRSRSSQHETSGPR